MARPHRARLAQRRRQRRGHRHGRVRGAACALVLRFPPWEEVSRRLTRRTGSRGDEAGGRLLAHMHDACLLHRDSVAAHHSPVFHSVRFSHSTFVSRLFLIPNTFASRFSGPAPLLLRHRRDRPILSFEAALARCCIACLACPSLLRASVFIQPAWRRRRRLPAHWHIRLFAHSPVA